MCDYMILWFYFCYVFVFLSKDWHMSQSCFAIGYFSSIDCFTANVFRLQTAEHWCFAHFSKVQSRNWLQTITGGLDKLQEICCFLPPTSVCHETWWIWRCWQHDINFRKGVQNTYYFFPHSQANTRRDCCLQLLMLTLNLYWCYIDAKHANHQYKTLHIEQKFKMSSPWSFHLLG